MISSSVDSLCYIYVYIKVASEIHTSTSLKYRPRNSANQVNTVYGQDHLLG